MPNKRHDYTGHRHPAEAPGEDMASVIGMKYFVSQPLVMPVAELDVPRCEYEACGQPLVIDTRQAVANNKRYCCPSHRTRAWEQRKYAVTV